MVSRGPGLRPVGVALAMVGTLAGTALADEPRAEPEPAPAVGLVTIRPVPEDDEVVPRFRLSREPFRYAVRPLETVSASYTIHEVTFPSPVSTPHPANNTVHCEYFLPRAAGPHSAVIVLHILGGDFDLARLFARQLAERGVAALFLKMPYYGPRRAEGVPARMVSDDPRATVEGLTQAVLDVRRATALLAARPEVDSRRLGIFGISLGGITAALAAGNEPRLGHVCLLLAGGDLGQVAWESPALTRVRTRWEAEGGTRETLLELMREVDPITYAPRLRGRRVLMLNALRDEVIPPRCTEALWQALGEPPIRWIDAGHYSSAWYLLDSLQWVGAFFAPDESMPRPATSAEGSR